MFIKYSDNDIKGERGDWVARHCGEQRWILLHAGSTNKLTYFQQVQEQAF